MSDTVTPDHDDTELSEHDKRRKALIFGLLGLAAWYGEHPDAPLPRYPSLGHVIMADNDSDGIAEVEHIAALLGVPVTYSTHARAARQFDGLEFVVAYASRESMANWNAHMAKRPPVETPLTPVDPAPWIAAINDAIQEHAENAPHAYPDGSTA